MFSFSPPRTPRLSLSPSPAAAPKQISASNPIQLQPALTRDVLREELDTFARGTLAALLEQRLTDMSEWMSQSVNENLNSTLHSLKQNHVGFSSERSFSTQSLATQASPTSRRKSERRFTRKISPVSRLKPFADGNEPSSREFMNSRNLTYKSFDPGKAHHYDQHWHEIDPEFVDAFPVEEPIGELHEPFVSYAWSTSRPRTFEDLTFLTESNESEDSENAEFRARTVLLTNMQHHPFSFSCLAAFVNTSHFENVSGTVILLNALFIGIVTDCHLSNAFAGKLSSNSVPMVLRCIDWLFVFVFCVELILRLIAYQSGLIRRHDFAWNVFDACVLVVQSLEMAFMRLLTGRLAVDLSFVKMLRILRLVRILRILRVVRQLVPLANLVASILNSIKSLVWTLLLLFIVIYLFSVVFTQLVWIALEDGAEDMEGLRRWFGSMARTSLTLYECITGGISWCDIVEVLIFNLSPAAACLFCIYIAICVFILCNIVTGVFVEQATGMEREASEEAAAKSIRDLFLGQDSLGGGSISASHFRRMLHHKEMQKYFKVVNVCPSEGVSLFRLLDVDDSGTLDAHELVEGLLRLRGHSKALEHALLMRQVRCMDFDFCSRMEELFDVMFDFQREMQETLSQAGITASVTQAKAKHISRRPEAAESLRSMQSSRSMKSMRSMQSMRTSGSSDGSTSDQGEDLTPNCDKVRNEIINKRNSRQISPP